MKVDKLINQENGKALVIQYEIELLERKLSKLANKIGSKRAELKDICIHNETINNESYIEGGYLNKSEYITTTICKTCGKELDKKVKYGGFG